MANRQNKSSSRKSRQDSGKPPQEETDRRDPLEIRTESFRVAAGRETVEAFVVAFILALLFRAFLAEAFVIPTGSMAPTLMGAHKDLVCERCGAAFQVGASRERNGGETSLVVVAGVCPNCRFVNALDLSDDSNHATFNGDRILVSKFSYAFADPERWDVIVFKYPGNPKQNYIKRLIGLPNETLTLRHGDVFMRPTGSDVEDVILRKPADTLLAMSHLVYDTDHQSQVLIDADYPSRWQPWQELAATPPLDSWKIQRSGDGMTATLADASGDRFKWMRYYHRWPTDPQWDQASEGKSLADVDPYSSRAITDFYAYDSYAHVPAGYVYEKRPSASGGNFLQRMFNGGYSRGVFSPDYRSGGGLEQFGRAAAWGGQDFGQQQLGRDGLHWVGDLIVEADLETSTDASEAVLELVEAGIKFRCRFDLQTGEAKLSIDDVEPRSFDPAAGVDNVQPTAVTSMRAGTRHTIRFSNCDDELLLWVDGDPVSFEVPTTFDSLAMRTDAENQPMYLDTHPLDASPVGIAVRGGSATVRHLRIDRDKYYIATQDCNSAMSDYDMNQLLSALGRRGISHADIQQLLMTPSAWADHPLWASRRRVSFELKEDQFFPMGDNSPESLDARCWAGSKRHFQLPRGVNEDAWIWSDESWVPRELLVGKALVVFWPHSWNSPIPFTPNVKRMKLIR